MGRTIQPPPPSAHPGEAGVEATATHRFLRVNGLRLHVLDLGGDGRPVVFLHGVGGNAWMWLGVCRLLGVPARRLAIDFRGYGESQWSSELSYTTGDHVSDLEGIVEALGLQELDVVGFSWGGLVALELAARCHRVRRVVVVDAPPSFEQSETDIPALAYDFPDIDAVVEAERRMCPRAGEDTLQRVAAFAVRPSEGGRLVKKHDAYFLLRWPFRSDDHWDEVRSLRQPLLVVHAADSPVLSAETAARMVQEASDARLEEIPDCGHMVPVERPAELAAALERFLA